MSNRVDTETPDVITLQQCVTSAKMLLGIENSDNDIWFGKLGNDAIRRLNTLSIFIKKQCQLTINNGRAVIPKEYQDFLAMRLNSTPDSEGCVLRYGFVYVDNDYLSYNKNNNTPNAAVSNMKGVFQINGGHIIFYGGIPDGTVVDFAYKAKNVDENGLQIVYSRYEDALTYFICYNFALSNFALFNQYIIAEYKMNWQAQKRMLKSYDARQSFNNDKAQIREITNALIVDKGAWGVGMRYY